MTISLVNIVSRCGQLLLENGTVSYSDGLNEGSVATHTCNPEFTLTGSVTRTCTSEGVWSLPAPLCLPGTKSFHT